MIRNGNTKQDGTRQSGITTPYLVPLGGWPPYHIILYGRIPSKKNAYTPRKDRPGVFKNAKLRTALDRLALQIPGWMRDLRLRHPEIDVWFTVPANSRHEHPEDSDRDGKLVTVLDLLVTYGVLAEDSIRHCNGTIRIHPAEIGEEHLTRIVLTSTSGQPEQNTRRDTPWKT